jgi:hypothetical protein
MPILQAIMQNPASAANYMSDPRVKKILEVLQSNTGND